MYVIIGASGFIGSHLYDHYKRNKTDVLGTYCKHAYCPEWKYFDLCTDNFSDLADRYLDHGKKHAVIICGANTSIDGCKRDESASKCLNVSGVQKVLEQANQRGIKCVFLSSEAVFNGRQGMYSEEDIPDPVTLYGKQKLQIEQYMIHHLDNYLIFRLSRAAGSSFGEKDIFNEFYTKIMRGEEIVCLKNQSFCLTEIGDIVCGITQALKQGKNGLYHLSSANYISRYELADLYARKIFGGYEKILEKEYKEMSFLDDRHIYGGLKGNKSVDLLGIHYMGLNEILYRYFKTYQKEMQI